MEEDIGAYLITWIIRIGAPIILIFIYFWWKGRKSKKKVSEVPQEIKKQSDPEDLEKLESKLKTLELKEKIKTLEEKLEEKPKEK